jgi:cell division protein FtsA
MRKRVLADPDLKIVDIVPDTFIIDNNERFDHEPLGKVSKVLSLHASIYAMNDKVVSQFESVVNKAGYEVKYKVNAPYASALYLSTISNIPNTYILVDIGESITTISKVHNKTSIIHSKMIKFGGRNITQEIAEQFNIDYDDAERLKRIYGIDYNPNFTAYIHDKIQLDDLADVILNVLKPLLLKVKSVINEFSIDNNERLPVVLSGGTSELHNINDIVEDVLETKVVKYSVESIGARDKSLISILGSIKYGAIQPTVDEEEIASTTINRVETNKKSKSYKFDEEL